MKKLEPIREKDGKLVIDLDATAADADWMRAGRLRRRAEAGDEEARKELEVMENTPLYVNED